MAAPLALSTGQLRQIATMSAQPTQSIDATPQEVDLKLYKGDDFFADLVVTNQDGTPYDLGASVASSQIRQAPNASKIVASFACTIEDNVIHLHLSHAQSKSLLAGVTPLAWDIQITDRAVGATAVTNWKWTNDTTQAVGIGTIGIGVGTAWNTAATVNINQTDVNNADQTALLTQLAKETGNQFTVALADNPAGNYGTYMLSAPGIKVTNWWEFPVSVVSYSPAVIPANNDPMLLTTPAAAVITLCAGSVLVSGEVTMP